MNEKYALPGAIVLAGALIAGAIALTRLPAGTVSRSPAGGPAAPAEPSTVAGAAESPKIDIRPVDASRDHVRGDASAPVTLVEYSDTECPFCKRFHPTLKQAVEEYQGKVRWVYRHYPLDVLHKKARNEAAATECASEQGKFWEYVDRLFEITPSNDGLEEGQLPVIARDVGLDVADFEKCLASGRATARVSEDLADAEKAGGQGTPHTVILGPKGETIPFPGAQPYSNLKQVIDGLLKEG